MRTGAECIPLPPNKLAVPAHERWRGEEQCGGRQRASQSGEDEAIGWQQLWTLDLAPEDGHLVAQREQLKIAARLGLSPEQGRCRSASATANKWTRGSRASTVTGWAWSRKPANVARQLRHREGACIPCVARCRPDQNGVSVPHTIDALSRAPLRYATRGWTAPKFHGERDILAQPLLLRLLLNPVETQLDWARRGG